VRNPLVSTFRTYFQAKDDPDGGDSTQLAIGPSLQLYLKPAQTALEFPPMQKGASFNLQQLKEELEKKMAAHAAQ